MSKDIVQIEVNSFIGEIILNNPPVNALNTEMVTQITNAAEKINDLALNREIRVVILRSIGKHFCAGADLKERLDVPESKVASSVKGIRKAVEAIWDLKIPVIAAIHGSAFGGGFELALAADIRLAANNARIGLKEVSLAIIPGAGGTQRLSRIVGMGRALEWIITGKDINLDEANNSGLVNEIIPENKLVDSAQKLAELITQNGPVGVRAAKKAVREGFDKSFKEAFEIEWTEYLKTIPTQDRVEGLKAFNEKRKPEYKGY